jgi:hypothetical protein
MSRLNSFGVTDFVYFWVRDARIHRMRMRWKSPSILTATTALTIIAAGSALAGPGAARAATGAAPGTQVSGTLANGTTWIAEYPKSWNGTLILYSHGFGPLTAADAPDPDTQAALLADGYALAGSSYDPKGSEWALDTAVSDQFGALTAVESTVLPSRPRHVIAFGTSMGGLVSALEAEQGTGKIDGALTTCGVVGGGLSLNEYQLDGEYAIARLLGSPDTQLVGFNGSDAAASATAAALTGDAATGQQTAAGRARLALAMAFLNVTPWGPAATAPAPAGDAAAQESAQYDTLFTGSFSTMDFIELGRVSFEQAEGGQDAWDVGTNFALALANSPYRPEVEALYKAAGLNLNADLAGLTANTSTVGDANALWNLIVTSDPTGWLEVPELDLHTIGDNLVPVQNENYYAQQVNQAGSGALLRQAYTESYGHCNFSVSEQVAGVAALMHRVSTGQWDNVATPASLEQAADAMNLGPAHFTGYSPGKLTGAVPGF